MGILWKDHAFANLVTLVPTAKVNVRLLSNTKVSGISCYRHIRGGKSKLNPLAFCNFFLRA